MRFLIFIFLLSSYPLYAQTGQNSLIKWFAGADIVGASGSKQAELESSFYVREFEFSANSQIDQTFEGVLTLSYHNEIENADQHLEVHEAFLISNSLLENTVFKVGKYFLGFGRINRFHRHDWVFTDAPIIQKAFFGNEGVKDTGIELKFNLPSLTSTLTVGITGGQEFNHVVHDHGDNDEDDSSHTKKGKSPTGYLRWAYFHEFSTLKGFELGANILNRRDEESIAYQYAGIDFIYKDRIGKVVENLIQAEIWTNKELHTEGDEKEVFNNIGGYLYYERGLDQHHAIGVRADYYKPDSEVQEHLKAQGEEHAGIDGLEIESVYKAVSLSYIYTNSEFTRFRFTIEHLEGIKVDEKENVDSATRAFAQLVFSIGAHPAHVY